MFTEKYVLIIEELLHERQAETLLQAKQGNKQG